MGAAIMLRGNGDTRETDHGRFRGWRSLIAPDEQLLWHGQPNQRFFLFSGMDYFKVPLFFVIATIFGLIVLTQVISWAVLSEVKADFLLINAVVFAIAYYRSIWFVFSYARHRRQTHYALTDRRAMIVRPGSGNIAKEMRVASDMPLECRPGPRGSLQLGVPPFFTADPGGFGFQFDDPDVFVFAEIADAPQIEALIRGLKLAG
ncbi:MAG: hypothetical protein AAF441_13625 [Pseudomonadota bacterium]